MDLSRYINEIYFLMITFLSYSLISTTCCQHTIIIPYALFNSITFVLTILFAILSTSHFWSFLQLSSHLQIYFCVLQISSKTFLAFFCFSVPGFTVSTISNVYAFLNAMINIIIPLPCFSMSR